MEVFSPETASQEILIQRNGSNWSSPVADTVTTPLSDSATEENGKEASKSGLSDIDDQIMLPAVMNCATSDAGRPCRQIDPAIPVQMVELIECCVCNSKFEPTDIGASKLLKLCALHNEVIVKQKLGLSFGSKSIHGNKQESPDELFESDSDEQLNDCTTSYDEENDGSMEDQKDVVENHLKCAVSEDYKEITRLFEINKLYSGPQSAQDLGKVLNGIKKTTTRATISVSAYEVQVYDSRFDEDIAYRRCKSCFFKGVIKDVPDFPTLFGYDTFTAYYCSHKSYGYMCHAAICPLRDPKVISGYVLVSILRTRCNSPRVDAIIYSVFVKKCFRVVGFIKWIDGNFTNLSVKMPDDIHADIKRALHEFLDVGRWVYDPKRSHIHRNSRNPSVEDPKRFNMKETRELNDHVEPLMEYVNFDDVKGKPVVRSGKMITRDSSSGCERVLRATGNKEKVSSADSMKKTPPMLRSKSPVLLGSKDTKTKADSKPDIKSLNTLRKQSVNTSRQLRSISTSVSSSVNDVDGFGEESTDSLDALIGNDEGDGGGYDIPLKARSKSAKASFETTKNCGFVLLSEHKNAINRLKSEHKLEIGRKTKGFNNELKALNKIHADELKSINEESRVESKRKDRLIATLEANVKTLTAKNDQLQEELKKIAENIPPPTVQTSLFNGANKKCKNRNNRGAYVKEQNKDSSSSPDEGNKKKVASPVTDLPRSSNEDLKKKPKHSHTSGGEVMNRDDITSLIERMISAHGPKVARVESYCQPLDRLEQRHQDSYHSVDDRLATNFEDRGRSHVGRQVFNVGYGSREGGLRGPVSAVYRSDRPQSLYYSNDHVSSDRGYHHDQDTYYGSREREDVEDRYISRPLRDHRGGIESTIRYVPGPGREYSDDVRYSYR